MGRKRKGICATYDEKYGGKDDVDTNSNGVADVGNIDAIGNHIISIKIIFETFKTLHSCCSDNTDCLILWFL